MDKITSIFNEDPKYLPPKAHMVNTINTQIFESQSIIARNLIELEEFQRNNERMRIKEVDANNEVLKEKIDTFRALLYKLDPEAYEASGHPAL